MKHQVIASAALAVSFIATPLSAGVVQVSNLDESASGWDGPFSGSAASSWLVAGKFVTGDDMLMVDGATTLMNVNGSFGSTFTYEAILYTDSGDEPAALLAQSEAVTVPGGPVGTNYAPAEFVFDPTELDPDTAYWLVVRGLETRLLGWAVTRSDDENIARDGWSIADTGLALSFDNGGAWTDRDTVFANDSTHLFSISVVPTPAAAAALGFAGALVAGRRRRA